ncbi:MAG: AAA family ATPase [FCB group bacterium]|nr:AAA family ATPase [FCB group bacterium]
MATAETEIIEGTLESIFRQFDSGYLIGSIDPGGEKVLGTLPNPVIGDRLEFHGHWEEHPRYGRQFCFDLAVTVTPKTQQEMLEFLSQLKHIGPVRASSIMNRFGDNIFDILDDNPQRLTSISGITEKRVQTITGEWNRIKADKDTIFFLNGLGCNPRQRALIMEAYKENTVEMVKENPYRMIDDIKGFGFKVVDGFAKKLGFANDSPLRAEAAVEHILRSAAESKQHTFLPEGKIVENGISDFSIPKKRLKDAITKLSEHNTLVHDPGKWCALRLFYNREKDISVHLQRLMNDKSIPDSTQKIEESFSDPVSGQTITLNEKQLEAVEIACRNNVSIITGLPGTGKTTLLKAILNIYKDQRIQLASPTGKAAKRMEEATGMPACTVHRLLEYSPEEGIFKRGIETPLEADLIIIDESSMLDVWLTDCLLKAIAPGTKLILVGDADQLPSVGPGNVLADLLACEGIPSIKLTQIMRQAETSTIIKNAHRINRGLPIDIYSKKDFFFIEEDDPELLVKRIRKLVTDDIPTKFHLDPVNDIQVLCPQNVGPIGSIVFNNALQRSLNPARDYKPEVKIGGDDTSYYLRMGDRVIQTINNYTLGVFNGTTGVIAEVDPGSRKVWVDFGNGCKNQKVEQTCQSALEHRTWRTPVRTGTSLELVAYEHEQLPQLKLAYAISIHKSQGSEFSCVVIPIHFLNRYMLQRNLLYTGITRGKSLVVIVGTETAVDTCIENNRPTKRYTLLKKFLNSEIPIEDDTDNR